MRGYTLFFLLWFWASAFALQISVTDTSTYREAVQNAKLDDFRRNAFCKNHIDYLSEMNGWDQLYIITIHYPHFLRHLDAAKENDTVGQPLVYEFSHFGSFCPATTRYVKVAGDLQSYFGNLSNKKIVEIGAGYGGQCRILMHLFNVKDYTIIDLPEANSLTKKYLEKFGISHVKFINALDEVIPISSDLVISLEAFSECFEEAQLMYIDQILTRARSGYLICNDRSFEKRKSKFNKGTARSYLQKVAKKIEIQPEYPEVRPENYLIFWR